MSVPLCDLGPGIARDRARFLDAFGDLLDRGVFVLGPVVERFEQQLAAYLGRAHVVGVASCSDALELSLRALDLGPGKAVVTTPFTFVATAEAISNAGARPVFADIDPARWLLDLGALDEQLSALPRSPAGLPLLPSGEEVAAVMPVHLFGEVHEPAALRALSERHGLPIIEDAAQALGGSRDGVKAGAMGALGCFSFFPTKTLGGLGDGGAIATDDAALASRLRALRQHGSEGKARGGVPRERGRNSRLDALQAAMLSIKLEHLDDDIAERRALIGSYARRLSSVSDALRPLAPRVHPGHAGQQMIIRSPLRDALAAHLQAQGIGTAIYYPRPLHALPPYQDAPRLSPLSNAERACCEALALPLFPGLTAQSLDEVIEAVQGFVRAARGFPKEAPSAG